MIIENIDALSTSPQRRFALEIIESGIAAANPERLMCRAVSFNAAEKTLAIKKTIYDLGKGRVFVIGGGKASCPMAMALEKIVGAENLVAGVVSSDKPDCQTTKIKVVAASHPIPDRRGAGGVAEMLGLRERFGINAEDTVICLISGGGSALMPAPADGIALSEIQAVTGQLISSGASINEINVIRKHLSKIKGGRLGQFFSPARVVSIIISDVIGNDLSSIASGPTTPDPSTFADALDIIRKYGLEKSAFARTVSFMKSGAAGNVPDTPKSLANCSNHIIGDVNSALDAMAGKTSFAGVHAEILTSAQGGTPAGAAEHLAEVLSRRAFKTPCAIIFGGETTPKLPSNHGKGGRNQHLAACAVLAMRKFTKKWILAAAGTDGTDFVSGIAGAIVDNQTLDRAKQAGLDIPGYIQRYDAFSLFESLGNTLIKTGHTGTNVGDIGVCVFG